MSDNGLRLKNRRWWLLVPAILICLGVSALGAVATETGPGSWYETIAKAPWNPPSWVFGPVWTVLYIVMGIALWLLWTAPAGDQRRQALTLFWLQLGINLAWSWAFFGLESPWLALVDLVALIVVIVLFMRKAWWVVPVASLLMWPYLIWCGFAASLNAWIVLAN